MEKILLLHGPNLNLLGAREPDIYGVQTLDQINQQLEQLARHLGYELTSYQSNAEAELIAHIHNAFKNHTAFIIINPAAFTHTSIALRDALLAVNIPFIEIHLSNIHSRESFRQQSFFADKAVGVICGFGAYGYEMALRAAHHHLAQ